jgi:hypothetical protein
MHEDKHKEDRYKSRTAPHLYLDFYEEDRMPGYEMKCHNILADSEGHITLFLGCEAASLYPDF